jgi:hypothetical protein
MFGLAWKTMVNMRWLGMLAASPFVSLCGEGAPECKEGHLTWNSNLPPGVTSAFVCGDRWESPDRSDVTLTVVDPNRIQETLFLVWRSQSPSSLQVVRIPAIGVSGHPIERGFRYPQISADRQNLYFLLISAMHGQRLYSLRFSDGGISKPVSVMSGVEEYCVIRGGRHDGKLLINERTLGSKGIEYRNILLDGKSFASKTIPEIPGEGFFDKFIEAWSRPTGGQCSLSAVDRFIDEMWAKVRR